MSLREKKAEKNRVRIIDEALRLFQRRGFDQTTMQQIAEAAEVSPSTLYRYFASKDLIVLARFVTQAQSLPEHLRACPVDLPLPQALAKTILTALETTHELSSQSILIRNILDQNPIARARLWDMLEDLRRQLGETISERLRLPVTDLRVIMAARLAILVAETAGDIWRTHPKRRNASAIAGEIIRLLDSGAVPVPLMTDDHAPEGSDTVRASNFTNRRTSRGKRSL